MKIFWISHFLLYPDTGFGALQRSRNLLIELSKYHEIICLSYYRDVDIRESVNLVAARDDLEKYCKRVLFIPHLSYSGTRYKYVTFAKSIASARPYSALIYRSQEFRNSIVDIIEKESMDLLYSDTLGLSDDVLKRINIPRILNHHNIESDMMYRRARKERNRIKKALMFYEAYKIKAYEKKYCHLYSKNIVVSDLDKARLSRINPEANIEVVENGVNCSYFGFHPRKENGAELIFTGGLDWYPNLDAMVFFCKKVWPKLSAEIPGIRLTIIGKNPGTELDGIAEKHKNIFIKGFVPDVREYMKKASIFICPIRDGGGTKLKILDAMAQGVPIVSSTLGCEGIDAIDGTHLLIANKPDDYLSAVKDLIGNLEKQNKLAANAYNLVKDKYSYITLGLKFNQIVESA